MVGVLGVAKVPWVLGEPSEYLHASLADPKAMLRPRGSFLWREGVESKVGE